MVVSVSVWQAERCSVGRGFIEGMSSRASNNDGIGIGSPRRGHVLKKSERQHFKSSQFEPLWFCSLCAACLLLYVRKGCNHIIRINQNPVVGFLHLIDERAFALCRKHSIGNGPRHSVLVDFVAFELYEQPVHCTRNPSPSLYRRRGDWR